MMAGLNFQKTILTTTISNFRIHTHFLLLNNNNNNNNNNNDNNNNNNNNNKVSSYHNDKWSPKRETKNFVVEGMQTLCNLTYFWFHISSHKISRSGKTCVKESANRFSNAKGS